MRAVLIGAGTVAAMTAELLLKRGHEVVIIESNKERVAELSDQLDCGFLHGDGSKPAILKEADPQGTQVLFCLSGQDHVNILAGLVGLSLGYPRVVVKIEDPQFEHLCIELGLRDTIIPAQMTGRYLADMFEGQSLLELSAMIKDEARVFSFVLPEKEGPSIKELDLPAESRVISVYRQNKFIFPEDDTQLEPDDEVVVLTHRKNLPTLNTRWGRLVHRQ